MIDEDKKHAREEDDEWGTIAGLAAYFFDDPVKKGEIDPQKLLDRIGNA